MRDELRARLRAFANSPPSRKAGVTGVTGVTPPQKGAEHAPSHPSVTPRAAENPEQNQHVTPVTPVTPENSRDEENGGQRHTLGGVTATPGAGVTGPAISAEDWLAAFHERAGFLEFDCHLTRAEADRIALSELGEPSFGSAGPLDLNALMRRPSEARH